MNQRLTVYRRMAGVRTAPELDRLIDEVRDRYGPPPESVLNLAEYASIRLLADRIGLESLDREGQIVVLKFRPDAKVDPGVLFRVVKERGDLAMIPPTTVKMDLRSAPAAAPRPAPPVSPAPVRACRGQEGARSGGLRLVVGGAGQGRRGHVRLHPAGNHEAGEGRPASRGRPVRSGRQPPPAVERGSGAELKCSVSVI